MSREQFDRFYRDEVGALYRFVLVRVGNRQVAEDIAAETFSRVLRRMGEIALEHPRGYLYQVARNCILDDLKARRKTVPLEQEDFDQTILSELDRVSLDRRGIEIEQLTNRSVARSTLEKILGALGKEERLLLMLRYAEGLDWSTIANRMGKSVVAVRVGHHRAVRKLRKAFDKQNPNEEQT